MDLSSHWQGFLHGITALSITKRYARKDFKRSTRSGNFISSKIDFGILIPPATNLWATFTLDTPMPFAP